MGVQIYWPPIAGEYRLEGYFPSRSLVAPFLRVTLTVGGTVPLFHT
jgi:hypothetical protein